MRYRIPMAVAMAALLAAAASVQQPAFAQGSGGASPPAFAQQPAGPPSSQEPASAQAPPPVTFRVEINYVEVDAVVTDLQGRVVTDLTQADFDVLEDGRPQKIAAFSLVNLPVERPERPLFAGAPIEPDVQSNTAADGRIYMIVLDDLHTSFSNTARVKTFLRDFIDRNFGVNDLAAVVYTSGRATAGTEFTSSRRLLLDAFDKFTGRRLRSEALELSDALDRTAGLRDPENERDLRLLDPLEAERAHEARTMLTSLRNLAAFMEGVRGRRKALVLVSEGISYNIYDVINNSSAGIILQQASDAVAAATRANVAIYPVDPRGLSALEEQIEVAGTPQQFSATRTFMNTLRLSQDSLRTLAEQTGGFAAVERNDFASAFDRIVRENSTYYMLGYYPSNERRDGRFRRIEVRVKRPGLQVRSRRGYVAPRGRAPNPKPPSAPSALSAAATAAFNSPIPTTGVPLSLSAAAYKGAAPNASIALVLEMRADAFRFTEKNGTFNDRVEVAFSSVDAGGTVRFGDRHVLGMEMSAATTAATRERGFRVVSEMLLPPGRYQIRAVAAEEGANRTGSVFFDLEVPDFHKAGFTMSGVTLTSASAPGTPTVRPKNPLGDVLPAPPTAVREFARGDIVALFAEFYENLPNAPPHTIDISTTVRSDDGRMVFENREQRSSADLQGNSGGYGHGVEIPLAELAPGPYVIRVEGRSRATAAEASIAREVLIRIR